MSTRVEDLGRRPARPGWLFAFAVLLAGAVVLAGPLDWRVALGFLGPDLALVGLIGGQEPGRLHPRWVPAYNLLHHPASPLLLAVAAVALGPGVLAAACAWGAHLAMDRAAGYGLRDADGRQRA